jgi:hypothetical protein
VNRKPKVAGEIVSFCTKCGLDLNHVVVAMVAGVPKRVLCRTCGSEHAYRRPVEARVPSPPTPKRTSSAKSGSRSVGAALRAEAEAEKERAWRERISGRPTSAFTTYNPKTLFAHDQLVRHPKFGDGYVTRVIDAGKIEVMFRDGPRTLAHGLSGIS